MIRLPVITESDCHGCGACCRHVGHPMFCRPMGPRLPAEPGWKKLPRELKRELLEYLESITDDFGKPCIWLQPDGTCKHYHHRPQVCRDFERGSQDCLEFLQAKREQACSISC